VYELDSWKQVSARAVIVVWKSEQGETRIKKNLYTLHINGGSPHYHCPSFFSFVYSLFLAFRYWFSLWGGYWFS